MHIQIYWYNLCIFSSAHVINFSSQVYQKRSGLKEITACAFTETVKALSIFSSSSSGTLNPPFMDCCYFFFFFCYLFSFFFYLFCTNAVD